MKSSFRVILSVFLVLASCAFGTVGTTGPSCEATEQLAPSPLNIAFLPQTIPIRITHSEAADLYRRAREAWDQQYDPQFLKTALSRLAGGDVSFLTKENKKRLKAIRKASDMLRTAFLMLDESHDVPQKLHEFVTHFGDMDDTIDTAIKRGFGDKVKDRIVEEAKVLQKELIKIDFKKQLAKFTPARRKSIRQQLDAVSDKTKRLMAAPSLSNDEFHTVRKAVRKLGKIFTLTSQASGSIETQKVADYLLELSHVLGKIHAEAVSDDITGVRSYAETQVTIPPELQAYLQAFFSRLRTE